MAKALKKLAPGAPSSPFMRPIVKIGVCERTTAQRGMQFEPGDRSFLAAAPIRMEGSLIFNRTMYVASPVLSLILSGLDNISETALVDTAPV